MRTCIQKREGEAILKMMIHGKLDHAFEKLLNEEEELRARRINDGNSNLILH